MRGRFAPSPTGRLHLGNARTALLGWLQMRALGGAFLLRIEDLDAGRVRQNLVDALFRDLEYLGLTWDEPPLYQSERAEIYREAVEALDAQGLTYPCFCSRAEIARAASAPQSPSDEGPRYPGLCRTLTAQQRTAREKQRQPALRFRVPDATVHFADVLHGAQSQNVADVVGDFVLRKNDGTASYQLAVVVDDAASGITHVLRGEDLLSSTARQIQLYRALGQTPPQYTHVPLVLDASGKRLAKRDNAVAVTALREAGVPAALLVGRLAQWCGLGDGTPTTAADLVSSFSLDPLPRAPVRVPHG